jgi:hypothetical protein
MTTLEMMAEAKANPGVAYCVALGINKAYCKYSFEAWSMWWGGDYRAPASAMHDFQGWRRAE